MGIFVVKPLLDAPVGTYMMFLDSHNVYRKADQESWVSILGVNKGCAFIHRNFQSVMETETWVLS